jgi:hypothetical protein
MLETDCCEIRDPASQNLETFRPALFQLEKELARVNV